MEIQSRDRSESPAVPPVAESVEIMTDPSELPFKRSSASNWERQAAKNPRLTKGWAVSLSHAHFLCVYTCTYVWYMSTCVWCVSMCMCVCVHVTDVIMYMCCIPMGNIWIALNLSTLLVFCYQDCTVVSFQDPEHFYVVVFGSTHWRSGNG